MCVFHISLLLKRLFGPKGPIPDSSEGEMQPKKATRASAINLPARTGHSLILIAAVIPGCLLNALKRRHFKTRLRKPTVCVILAWISSDQDCSLFSLYCQASRSSFFKLPDLSQRGACRIALPEMTARWLHLLPRNDICAHAKL